jgi:hypothetical protein
MRAALTYGATIGSAGVGSTRSEIGATWRF